MMHTARPVVCVCVCVCVYVCLQAPPPGWRGIMPAMEVVAPEKPPYKNVSDEHIFSVGAGYDLAFGTLTKKQLIFAPPLPAYFPGGKGLRFWC
jgi:hypothetical protein